MKLKRIGFICLSLSLALILSGCFSSSAPVEETIDSSQENTEVTEEEPTPEEPEFLPGEIPEDNEDAPMTQPITGELNIDQDNPDLVDNENVDTSNTRTFYMIARNFEFVPSVINVKQNNKIVLNIAGEDEEHNLVIDAYKINKTIPVGLNTVIEFTADQKGVFDFYSNIYSGAGTSNMKGQLIVE